MFFPSAFLGMAQNAAEVLVPPHRTGMRPTDVLRAAFGSVGRRYRWKLFESKVEHFTLLKRVPREPSAAPPRHVLAAHVVKRKPRHPSAPPPTHAIAAHVKANVRTRIRQHDLKKQLVEKWLVFQDLKEQLRQTKAEMDGLAKELHLEKDRHTADRGKLGPQRRRQAKPNTKAVS